MWVIRPVLTLGSCSQEMVACLKGAGGAGYTGRDQLGLGGRKGDALHTSSDLEGVCWWGQSRYTRTFCNDLWMLQSSVRPAPTP